MPIHGLRPEFQPEAIIAKAKVAQEANAQADKPVRGHDEVAPPAKPEATVIASSSLLDIKG